MVAPDDLHVTTNVDEMNFDDIHDYLCNDSYWSAGIPRETLQRAMANSLCFGIVDGGRQAAFARVITDRATYAYLCDVYVHPDHRGRGFARRLLLAMDAHEALQGLRRWNLVTRDAHGLYAQFGFVAPANPAGYMERRFPDVYRRS